MTFKIFIAVDDSKQAETAFKSYISHLHKEGNEVIIGHVSEPPINNTQDPLPTEQWKGMLTKMEENHAILKEKFCGSLDELNIKCEYRRSEGKPGEQLCELIEQEGNISIVVIGTRGLGAVRRTIMGSVSDYVLHHVNVPVMICKGE